MLNPVFTNILICKLYRCREIRNTDDFPWFRYETFINFLTLVFRHEERKTQFLLCWLYYLTQQTRCASRSPLFDWPGPESDLNIFFKITKFSAHRFRAWRHSHPSPISYLGFLLWHLWLSYPLRAWTLLNVCAPALRSEQFKAQLNRMIKYN